MTDGVLLCPFMESMWVRERLEERTPRRNTKQEEHSQGAKVSEVGS